MLRNRKKRMICFGLFTLLASIFPVFFGTLVTRADYSSPDVNLASDTVTVNLHKVEYNGSDLHQNTGVLDSAWATGKQVIAGVGFTLYDISDYYYALRDGTLDVYATGAVVPAANGVHSASLDSGKVPVAQRPLADNNDPLGAYQILVEWLKDKLASDFGGSGIGTAVNIGSIETPVYEVKTAAGTGLATFPNVPAGHLYGGVYRDAVYAIVETDITTAAPTVNRSINTILALPAYQMVSDGSGGLKRGDTRLGDTATPIDIYPKNRTPNMWKTLTKIEHKLSGLGTYVIPDVYTKAQTDRADAEIANSESIYFGQDRVYVLNALFGPPLDPHIDKAHSDVADKAIYPVSIGDILTYKISFNIPSSGTGNGVVAGGINVYDAFPVGLRVYEMTSVSIGSAGLLGGSKTVVPIPSTTTIPGPQNAQLTYAFTEMTFAGEAPYKTVHGQPLDIAPLTLVNASGADVVLNIPYALFAPVDGARLLTIEFKVIVDGGGITGTSPYGFNGGTSPAVCDQLLWNEFLFNNGDNWLSEQDEETPNNDTAKVQMGDMKFIKIDGDSNAAISGAVFNLFAGTNPNPIPLTTMVVGNDTDTPLVLRPTLDTRAAAAAAAAEVPPSLITILTDYVEPENTTVGSVGYISTDFTIPKTGVWIYGLESSAYTGLVDNAVLGATYTKGFVNGTATGFYALSEKEPPTNYIRPSNPLVPFDIMSKNYANNVDISGTGIIAEYPGYTPAINYHKGTLPSTGGTGIYYLLVIGLVGMGVITILWVRNRKREKEGFDIE